MQVDTLDNLKQQRFKAVQRKAVHLPQGELVRTSLLAPDNPLPLVIEPAINDLALTEWASANKQLLEQNLVQHGALLFRNFKIGSPEEFRQFATVVYSKLAVFTANIHPTPKGEIVSKRTGVTYPINRKLRWHNEDSFDNFRWPSKIMFYCAKPAEQGGETPITDCRRLLHTIAPGTKQKFIDKGVMVVKNYYPELGMHWQSDFGTSDKSQMEGHCREASIEVTWKEDGQPRLRYVRPAVVPHPLTGEPIWFNQAQLVHVFFQDPEVRDLWQLSFTEENFPTNCYFGDGSPIDDDEMSDVVRAYDEIETIFPWQAGDILLLDNMLTAHARNPFVGAREIYVALDPTMTYRDIPFVSAMPPDVRRGSAPPSQD
jgi:alpha-ketoglutarate-dependent taurine dioxygenase